MEGSSLADTNEVAFLYQGECGDAAPLLADWDGMQANWEVSFLLFEGFKIFFCRGQFALCLGSMVAKLAN